MGFLEGYTVHGYTHTYMFRMAKSGVTATTISESPLSCLAC